MTKPPGTVVNATGRTSSGTVTQNPSQTAAQAEPMRPISEAQNDNVGEDGEQNPEEPKPPRTVR